MWVIGLQKCRAGIGESARSKTLNGRSVRVCYVENSDCIRAGPHENTRTGLVLVSSLRGEASRHYINLLCGQLRHYRFVDPRE